VPSGAGGSAAAVGTRHDYAVSSALPIPDNDPHGLRQVITVPDAFTLGNASVSVDISHPYIGDLIVVLAHGGVSATLQYRAGACTRTSCTRTSATSSSRSPTTASPRRS